jgi:hypothetical protein
VTLAGIVIEVRSEPENADSPMDVTPSGIEIEVIDEFSKARLLIDVTPSGITTVPEQSPPLDTTRLVIV